MYRLSYKKRIFLYFALLFVIFTASIILLNKQQMVHERTQSLENNLHIYAEFVHQYIDANDALKNASLKNSETLNRYLPKDTRLTVIDKEGKVLHDNVLDASRMGNHLYRPEIQKSIKQPKGANIRISDSNGKKYLYYAKKYNGYFVRVALPYKIAVKPFLYSGNTFIYLIILFLLVFLLLMNYLSNRFAKSIERLKDFSLMIKDNKSVPEDVSFPDDELGEIGANIVDNYNLLQKNKRKLSLEREKLLQHFQYSEEGIAIFTRKKKKIYANAHFLQYLNVILDEPSLDASEALTDNNFKEIMAFLDMTPRYDSIHSKRIEKNGKQLNVRVIVFDDNSFELNISDITKQEKTRLLKQEMTNNIAHELRTPVTSIRGYLETLLDNENYNQKRQHSFIERAYFQAIRLSELIQDISLLTKIEEAPDRFDIQKVNIKELLEELSSDLEEKFNKKHIRFFIDVSSDVHIEGSRTLLYSIFRNLAENAIAYGGENIDIGINCYSQSKESLYFDFYDTGVGVEEKHLVRIFERFYRVNEGRTRNTGGSGLGLSIVKNAVRYHNGKIDAKNRPGGGLSFLITFPKKRV